MIEAIIYRYRCGIAWRDLPETFGPWQTVWQWHHRLGMTAVGLIATTLLKDRTGVPLDVAFERTGQWKMWVPEKR